MAKVVCVCVCLSLSFLPLDCCIVSGWFGVVLGFVTFGNVWCSENSQVYEAYCDYCANMLNRNTSFLVFSNSFFFPSCTQLLYALTG